ncbi:MAG: hypothetical protein R3B49_10740 [Phycisphaerales bacterium]
MSKGEPHEHDPFADSVPPALDGTSHETASELYAHGLLETLRLTDPSARERRIGRVMDAVRAGPPRRTRRRAGWGLLVRAAVPVAAVLLMVGLLSVFSISSGGTAVGAINRSVEALRTASDRRYHVWCLTSEHATPTPLPQAIVDMHAPGQMVVVHQPPWSREPVTVGRDGSGLWAIRDDGQVDRTSPERFFPPWSVDGDTLIVDSLDRLLEQLPSRYTLELREPAPIEGAGPAVYLRIRGVRRDNAGPMPLYVDVWLDRATTLPERVEMRWRDPGAPAGPAGASPGRGARGRPGPTPPGPIIIQRVDSPVLREGWFTPEAHQPGG